MTTDTTEDGSIPDRQRMTARGSKSLRRRVAGLAAIAFALCVVATGLSVYAINQHQKTLERAPRAVAQEFLNDLETSNNVQAYALLCPTTRSQFSKDDLQAVKSYQITDVTMDTVNNDAAAIVTVQITRGGGAVEQHTIPLSSENGQWLICGEPY